MFRLILRNTRNALLLACILLLICSFERLCRYDFAQIQLASSAQPDGGLQVDSFVFWNGMPVWEHHPNNPVSALSFFKTMSSWSLTSTKGRIRDAVEEYLDIPETALPVVDNVKIMLRRQTQNNHNKVLHNESKISTNDQPNRATTQPKTLENSKTSTNKDGDKDTMSPPHPDPKIGFLLHLSTCSQVEVDRWIEVWSSQANNRPFLFAVMLDADVEETCMSELESQLSLYNGTMRWQVFKGDRIGAALQSCQHTDSVLRDNLGGFQELVYYDHSAVRNGTSSSTLIRIFLANANVVSEFQCIGQPLLKPSFCDQETVKDCPEVRLAPSILQAASTRVEIS